METSDAITTTRYAGRHRIVDHRAPSVPGYDLLEPIGQGGSGAVWSATSPAGETVAIKVVPTSDVDGALIELAVLGRISEPHLVRLHEAVALADGSVALVLDHHGGGTVGSVVRARGHLAPGELVTVLSPVASTLARLHRLGVVHGDLSPDNVLLDLDGRPFVADLGVARIAGERPIELRGTEGFVAPEVLLGANPTAAADVHVLGALAWFCLTGEAPGPAVVRGRLADRAPGLPDDLVAIVEEALRTRPDDRPDADAMAVALFESAAAVPLVLVHQGDDVSQLTRRIRAAARPEVTTALGERGVAAAGRRALAGAAVVGAGAGRVGRRLGGSLRTLLPWVAVVSVVTAVSLAFLSWSSARDGARATTAAAGGASAPATTTDLRLVSDAPRTQPVGLVQALADARAEAWSTGLATRLVEVDAPRSPALARDTEVLAGVQRTKQRYVGLSFVVRDAAVVSESQGVVTIRTRIDTGAHLVRGPSGEVQRPAVSTAPVLLDLVSTDSGWRVHDVRAVQ